MNKRMLTLVVGVTISMLGTAAPAVALHGGPSEPVVAAHQHWINGQEVGPDACGNGMSLAFDHFHMNVHLGKPGLGVQRGDGDGLGLTSATGCE